MTFVWPLALLGLLAIPVLGGPLRARGRASAGREARALREPRARPEPVPSSPGWRRHVRPFARARRARRCSWSGSRDRTSSATSRATRRRSCSRSTPRARWPPTTSSPTRFDAAQAGGARVPRHGARQLQRRDRLVLDLGRRRCCRRRPTVRRRRPRSTQLRLGSGTAIGNAITRSVDLALAQRPGQRSRGRRPAAGSARRPRCCCSPTAPRRQATSARSRRRSAHAGSASRSRRSRSGRATPSSRCRCRVGSRSGSSSRRTCRRCVRSRSTTGGTFSEAPDAESLESVYRELGTRLARDRKRRRGDLGVRRAAAPCSCSSAARSRRSGSGGPVSGRVGDRGLARSSVALPRRRRRRPRRGRVQGPPDLPARRRARGSRSPRPPARVDRRLAAALPAPRLHRRRHRRAGLRPRRSTSASAARTASPVVAGRHDRPRGRVHRASTPAARRDRPRSVRSSAACRPRGGGGRGETAFRRPAAFVPTRALDRRVVAEAARLRRDRARRRRCPAGTRLVGSSHAFAFRTEAEPGLTLLRAVTVASRRHRAARRRDRLGRAEVPQRVPVDLQLHSLCSRGTR